METSKVRGNAKGPTSAAFAANLKRIRNSFQIDLAQLSVRLEEIGWSIPVAALSRLENGKRRIDIDDLMALANALGIPPVRLLDPEKTGPPYATTAPEDSQLVEIRAWLRDDLESLDSKGRLRYWIGQYDEAKMTLPRLEAQLKRWTEAAAEDPEDRAARQAVRFTEHEIERASAKIETANLQIKRLGQQVKELEDSEHGKY